MAIGKRTAGTEAVAHGINKFQKPNPDSGLCFGHDKEITESYESKQFESIAKRYGKEESAC